MADDPVCAIHGMPLSEHEEVLPWCEEASGEPDDDETASGCEVE